MRARVVAAGLTALLVTGCGGQASPERELADQVDAVTREANDRDADGLRDATSSLSDTVSAQREDGTLSAERAQRLLTLAATLRERADVLDPEVQARLKAEQEAERARQEADAERTAREQSEQAAQAEREQAARRAQEQADEQARGEAEGKARREAEEKARKDAEEQAPPPPQVPEDAAKEAEKAAEDAADGG